VSLPRSIVGTRHCRVLRLYHSDANGIDMIWAQARSILKNHNTARIASHPNLISLRIVSNPDRA